MEPLEVIVSEGNGLLAFRSKLGWCVVGPLSEEKDENKFHCNIISIKDSGTGKVPGQHFTVIAGKMVHEISLKKLSATDVKEKQIMSGSEINETLREVSVEDISFLEIMNQNCSWFGDHYVLLLLFIILWTRSSQIVYVHQWHTQNYTFYRLLYLIFF